MFNYLKEIKKEKIIIYLILFIALIIRTAYVIKFGVSEESFSDADGYNKYAITILSNTEWILNPSFFASFREPGYPIFLALIYFIFGIKNYLVVYIFQSILNVITIYLLYKIGKILFANKVSLFILAWSSIYIFYIRYSGELLRESLIYLLLILFVFLIIKYLSDPKKISYLILPALAFTLLIHTDGRYLLYAPFLLFVFIPFFNFKRIVRNYFYFLIFVFLFSTPWLLRNYIAYNGVVVINTATLDLSGKLENTRNELLDFSTITEVYDTKIYNGNKNYPTEEERKKIKAQPDSCKRSKEEIEMILNDVYPASTFVDRKLYFILDMWSPFDFGTSYSPFPHALIDGKWSLSHNLVSIMCYGLLLPFLLIGTFFIAKKKNKLAIIIIIVILTHFIIHSLAFGIERYRHPIDGFIIIIGIYGIFEVTDFLKHRKISKNEK